MPVSKISSSGRMPRSAIARARPTITSGAFTLACVRKFIEPRVRLAMSGRASSSRSSTSARLASSPTSRPLVVTHRTACGQRSRSPTTMSRNAERSHAGDPSAWRACRCNIVAPARGALGAVGDDLLDGQRHVRRVRPPCDHPGQGDVDDQRFVWTERMRDVITDGDARDCGTAGPLFLAGSGSLAVEIAEWASDAGFEIAGLVELVDASRIGTRVDGHLVVAAARAARRGRRGRRRGREPARRWALLAGAEPRTVDPSHGARVPDGDRSVPAASSGRAR